MYKEHHTKNMFYSIKTFLNISLYIKQLPKGLIGCIKIN